MITDEARRKMGWRKGLVLTRITKTCEVCGQPFETTPTSRQQFCCSVACSAKRRRKWPRAERCLKCGVEFMAKKPGQRYCSRGHSGRKRAAVSVRDVRPDIVRRAGNRCERCGWCMHPQILELHHRDRNQKNNQHDNLLLLCPNCHEADHFLAGDGRHRHRSLG